MFLGANKRVLTNALLFSALISLVTCSQVYLFRFIIRRADSYTPDMLNNLIWDLQTGITLLQIILTAGVFIHYFLILKRYMDMVPEEDRKQLGMLQEEYLGSNLSALDAMDVKKLLEIWAVILTGASAVNYFTSSLYRRFISELSDYMQSDPEHLAAVSFVYNGTHGFKYLGMMIALLLGIIITSIFLSDRNLMLCGLALSVLFVVSFAYLRMHTVTVFGHSVGIVWSSVIFHLVDVLGLVLLSVYLRRRYLGV